MELTAGQEADVQGIMAEMDCPKDFPCYESGFEDLAPVKAFSGTDVIACLNQTQSDCPKSFEFGSTTMLHECPLMLCECPLRKYVSLNLAR
jgi:hypothetical protein